MERLPPTLGLQHSKALTTVDEISRLGNHPVVQKHGIPYEQGSSRGSSSILTATGNM